MKPRRKRCVFVLEDMFSSVDMMHRAAKAAWLRNEVISNNIANVDTPGFKASRVRFEELLAEAASSDGGDLEMAVTHPGHIPGQTVAAFDEIEPEVVKDTSTSARLDGNNVNIENEMVELARNAIEYYAVVNKISSEFRKLDTAIKGA